MTFYSITNYTNENQHDQLYRSHMQEEGPQKEEITVVQSKAKQKPI